MGYRMVKLPTEIKYPQYFGVPLAEWQPEWGKPSVGFVEEKIKSPEEIREEIGFCEEVIKILDDLGNPSPGINGYCFALKWVLEDTGKE